MTRPLTHDEAFAALEAAALEVLPPQEQYEVLDHAATCPECGPALAALRDTAAQLAHTAPRVKMDAGRAAALRGRLLARGSSERQGVVIDIPAEVSPIIGLGAAPSRLSGRVVMWLAIAAGIAFVASSALLAYTWQDRERLRTALNQIKADDSVLAAQIDSMRSTLATNEQVLQSIGGARVRVVSLKSTGATPPVGWMVWDQDKSRWTFVARFLPPPRSGRTYQLWLVSKGNKISAGTFQPDANGQAVVRADYRLAADALDSVAVTDEPAGGVSQPTGQFVLAGNAK